MSVPLSKRKLSRYEFYDNAVRMRISITNLLLRDFGVKNKIRNVRFFSQDRFVYLKMNYRIEGKRIKIRPNKLTFKRERRRLKKFKRMLDKGKMTLKMISDSYQSWRGTVLRYKNCSRNIAYTDKIYKELFCEE